MGWRDFTEIKMLALQAADSNSIPGTIYGSLNTTRNDIKNKPEVAPEHC